MFSDKRRDILAKLLAGENLNVVHDNVRTASFNLKERTLTLPVWKTMDLDTYDHLVGHEVGHALYTPAADWASEVSGSPPNFHGYLNVVEDARIEKLIQRRYPGLRRSFIASYKTLLAQNFFGSDIEGINQKTLIDRLNVHFKCGESSGIVFKAHERVWVERLASVETWNDVVETTKALFEFCGVKHQEPIVPKNPDVMSENDFEDDLFDDAEEEITGGAGPEEESEDEEGDSSGEGEESEESEDVSGDAGDDASEEEEEGEGNDPASASDAGEDSSDESSDESESDEATPGDVGGESVEPEAPTTQDAFDSMIKDAFSDANSDRMFNTIRLPNSVKTSDHVVPYKKLLTMFDNDSHSRYRPETFMERATEGYAEYKRLNKASIDYMVKEFQMKKSADEYTRGHVAKTGVIDCVKMNNYHFSDDIFRRVTVVPEGKNHGMLIYVDWSGSMSGSVYKTVQQVLVLVDFCRLVGIPYRVYAFSDLDRVVALLPTYDAEYDISYDISKLDEDRLFISKFGLLEFFHDKMKSSEHQRMSKLILHTAKIHDMNRYQVDYYDVAPSWLNLSGTPLNSAIMVAMKLHDEFKTQNRVSKVNTFFLTDGESAPTAWVGTKTGRCTSHDYARRAVTTLQDEKTKKNYPFGQDLPGEDLTNVLLRVYRDRTGSTTIGYMITAGAALGYLRSAVRPMWNSYNYEDHNAVQEMYNVFKKEGYVKVGRSGYSEFFVISGKKMKIESTELKVKDDASTAQVRTAFKKSQGNRKGSRVLLGELMTLIS